MKKKFNEIKQLAASVAEKRTHVRTAFKKLLETLTAPVADISSDEPPVQAELLSVLTRDDYGREIGETYYLRLQFRADADFVLWKEEEDYGYDDVKEWRIYPQDEEPSRLREMAEKILEALQSIRDQLAERDKDYNETVKLLDDMVSKLEG